MATYPTNEIHNIPGENHNALYMVVGIILALVIAGFAFYYYAGDRAATPDSAGTIVERVIEPSTGTADTTNDSTTESNSLNMSVDDDGVSATSSTTTQQ